MSIKGYTKFFNMLGNRFIANGDYNAKHTYWGARVSNPQESSLLDVTVRLNLQVIATGEPTYWRIHANRRPNVLDLFVTKGINQQSFTIQACLDLKSDHIAIAGTILHLNVTQIKKLPTLHNSRTNWNYF